MNIFKYEYKAHKFIKLIFHLIFFIAGFIAGLTINSAKAYTISEYNDKVFNEDIIYNLLVENFPDFDINEFNKIWVNTNFPTSVNSNSSFTIQIIAYHKDTTFSFNKYESVSTQYGTATLSRYISNLNVKYYSLYINSYKLFNSNPGGNVLQKLNYSSGNAGKSSSILINEDSPYHIANSKYQYYITNFDFSSPNPYYNVLNFGGTSLNFNPDLFKNNPDFKEVCVDSNSRFSITSNNYDVLNESDIKYFFGVDFLWFSYVPDGLSTYLYDINNDNHVVIFDEDNGPFFNGVNPGYWYYLDEKSEIDKYFNTSSQDDYALGVVLQNDGYLNKYDYYGWYMHPFVVSVNNSNSQEIQFSVFHFKDDVKFYSVFEDGLVEFEELENARNDNICFYINKKYDVTVLNQDVFCDDIGNVTILGGVDYDIKTSVKSNSIDSKDLFSKINLFIKNIRGTVSFINGYIYDLYLSMPFIVQLFIISVLGLIVIRILIGMVTR